jgi:hypothetical protein
MKVAQFRYHPRDGWSPPLPPPGAGSRVGLVMAFGASEHLAGPSLLEPLAAAWPEAVLVGCTTAGEIAGTRVYDHALVATAVTFDAVRVRGTALALERMEESEAAGRTLGMRLREDDLAHVLLLSDGLRVNGSELARGIAEVLPAGVAVTGGLAGDGEAFRETRAFLGPRPEPGCVVGVGLYGDALRIGYGSLGGWDPFGPERLVTRSAGNVLHELDGRSALDLYRTYLGEYADQLPASGLLFPLRVRRPGKREEGVVRTILSIDNETGTMTFAGDVPEGAYAQFMKANFERLIDGATGAARASHERLGKGPADLALLISCVGRKMVLKQRIEEEVEGVRDVLGDEAVLAGFYSYGEISPLVTEARCALHNQTMTITTMSEAARG